MPTDFNRVQQLVGSLVTIQHMQAAFAAPGATAPTITINFSVNHAQVGTPADPFADPPAPASADYKPAWSEPFIYTISLPPDVAGACATALADAVTAAMAAMNLPTS